MPPRYKFEFRFFFLNFFRCCSGDMAERKRVVPSSPVDSDAETQPLESDLSSDGEFSSDSDAEEDGPELLPEFKGVSTPAILTDCSSSSSTTISDLTPPLLEHKTLGHSSETMPMIPSPELSPEQLRSMGNIHSSTVVCESSGRRFTVKSPHSLSIMQQFLAPILQSTGSCGSSSTLPETAPGASSPLLPSRRMSA